MSVFVNKQKTITSSCVLRFFLCQDEDNDLNLNPYYQRDYVWDEKNAQALMYTVFNKLPMGAVSLVLDSNAEQYCEVVDGKQRITTLLNFHKNKFPVYISKKTGLVLLPESMLDDDAVAVYYKDLSEQDQSEFKKTKLSTVELQSNDESKKVSEIDKLNYFYRVNFAGVPISKEHHEKVLALIEQAQIQG